MNSSASASTTSTSISAGDRPTLCGVDAFHPVLRDVVGVEHRGPDLQPVLLEDPRHRHVEAGIRHLRHTTGAIVNDGPGRHRVASWPLDGLDVPYLGAEEGHGQVAAFERRADQDSG